MMKRLSLISRAAFIVCCLTVACNLHAQKTTCRIRGEVFDRNSEYLVLIPETEDPRFSGVKIMIQGNRFDYAFAVEDVVQYELIFAEELERGAWKPVPFFPDAGDIEFKLYPSEQHSRNVIRGGELNRKKALYEHRIDSVFTPVMKPCYAVLDSLWKANAYFSDKVNAINEQLRTSKDEDLDQRLYRERERLENSGEMYSAEAAIQVHRLDSVGRIRMYWQDDYIQSSLDLFSLSLIYASLVQYNQTKKGADITFINDLFPKFRDRYPGHPYTVRISRMLQAINTLKPGSAYIDFEAPTLEGKRVRISDSIAGRVALIDLWASWCGPCRALNRSMIPVYEKYKPKGFTVIGVGCEFKNSNAFKAALERDGYPWLNLIELDNRNGIWSKYNISGSGGSTFLVDRNGIIIAIHPTAEELDKILAEVFKSER